MNEFCKDILTTLIGVFTGGMLTIWVNWITEKKKIKMEMELNSLNDIVPALKDCSVGIAQMIIDISEIEDISTYNPLYAVNNSFVSKLVNVYENNKYVLYPFGKDLLHIYLKKSEADKSWQKSTVVLIELSKKYNKVSIEELLIYEDVQSIIEETFNQYSEVGDYIPNVINEINKTFLGNIFK